MSGEQYYQTEYYVDGNTIRKRQKAVTGHAYAQLNTAHQQVRRERLEEVPVRRRQAEKEIQREAAVRTLPVQNWDVKSILVIVAALVVTFYMCISYLEAQEMVTAMSKKAASLESEIMTLKNENDAAYNRIDSSVDLQYVYDVAVNELGMVHAKDSQVVAYNSRKSNSVRQYGEIPTETEQNYYRLSGN